MTALRAADTWAALGNAIPGPERDAIFPTIAAIPCLQRNHPVMVVHDSWPGQREPMSQRMMNTAQLEERASLKSFSRFTMDGTSSFSPISVNQRGIRHPYPVGDGLHREQEPPECPGSGPLAVQCQEQRWTAELAIPFAALDSDAKPAGTWRFNICRNALIGPSTMVPNLS